DAWATALTAMPYEQALATAEQQDIAAMFVILVDNSNIDADSVEDWQIVETSAMQALRADKPS
ncbi:MAG TPA: thiamine biosynthesis protein, partial [Psychrobacter sp.]|nr:thiamine biosynthesis protein [Psychrobacter sp.]